VGAAAVLYTYSARMGRFTGYDHRGATTRASDTSGRVHQPTVGVSFGERDRCWMDAGSGRSARCVLRDATLAGWLVSTVDSRLGQLTCVLGERLPVSRIDRWQHRGATRRQSMLGSQTRCVLARYRVAPHERGRHRPGRSVADNT
jgi:hypothetical protein